MSRPELLVLALVAGIILLSLLGLMTALTLARQRRAWRVERTTRRLRAARQPGEASRIENTSPRAIVDTLAQAREREQFPEHLRLPVRDAAPDQLVIDIHPPDGPTRDQRNVRRLIDYFEAERDGKG
jgi:type II secretory pathway pseudopilin PulG